MWNFIGDHLGKLLIGLNYLLALGAAVAIVMRNTNPNRTLSYVLALLLIPFVGLLFYVLFGQEYRRTRMFRRKNVLNQVNIKKWRQSLDVYQNEVNSLEKKPLKLKSKLIRLMQATKQSPLTLHNKVEVLINGEEKFSRLFDDIKKSNSSIHLEYYIFRDDKIGSELIKLLCDKAEEGVEVRINYDYVASSISNKAKDKLRKAGVEFYPFLPVYFPRFASKLNYRNHRKIAVIDGRIGYVGGINVGDEYVNTEGQRYWRDTHLRIEGESVGVIQLQFMLNWDFVSEEDIRIKDEWFPEVNERTEIPMQMAMSGPDTQWAYIKEAMFVAINSASEYLYLTTPYFIPNDEILTALLAASRSGVKVKLLIPGISDSRVAKFASYSYIERMLEAGIEVYLYQKGILHAKTMVIDGCFSTVGTSNIDYRSFDINFEINALMYHEGIAGDLAAQFHEDLKDSTRIEPEVWKVRPMKQKLKESFCRLWAPLL
ncbi:cardiolipin synthase [Robertkochia sediminum]|uniref:cardiolipin synthase n=1 Tax=Robertkochia sediminum TaxID=2785326 RepID=UPI0019334056|nr:cardiolipin synthase [Robertkochia sediminum]MBL7473132.1 cardiolipin synthase [Robertkochia sediminum]